MKNFINPFVYARSISPAEFSGRRAELNRIGGRLATSQSVAVIGQPHVGKTSLLEFLADAAARNAYFGEQFERDYFVFIDVLATQGICAQADFWQHALGPLRSGGHLALYDIAAQAGFNNFALEQVFDSLHRENRKLILLLDEFDTLLSHSILHNTDFYGGLRTLASRSEGFVLLIAARNPLERLNQLTQELNPHGSPYFNVFVEIQLGALKPAALTELLDRGGGHLNETDREYVARVSGRHPYLAQVAAAMLWDATADELTGQARYRTVGQNIYRQTRQHFADTWRFWSNATRKAVTAVALAEIPRLLASHQFQVRELVEDFDDFGPELDLLQVSGMLIQNENGEWVVAQDALLWWLADELRRNIRDETAFAEWACAQEMDNLLTQRDRQRLQGAAQATLNVLGRGATTLIETLAKGFGEAILK